MHIYNTENMLGRILFQYILNIILSLFILLELYTKNNYIYILCTYFLSIQELTFCMPCCANKVVAKYNQCQTPMTLTNAWETTGHLTPWEQWPLLHLFIWTTFVYL